MGNPVTHFEINGRDGAALGTFYAEAFGWHVDANNPMNYGMVDTHGAGINGGIGSSDDPDRQWVTIYIEVPDLQAALDKIEKLGGKTINPPMEVPGVVSLAHFADPEGHLIGLVKSQS